MNFDDVKAQPNAVRVLRAALASGRIASAYLFEGPAGVGKERAALALASASICPVKPLVGCGRCDTCRRVESGKHPDVRIVVPRDEGDRNLQVEYVRSEILPFAQFAPFEAPHAWLIFRDADVALPAHHAEAANALLKTIEEPRANVHFVFLVERPERLLSTIRSRAQRLRFQRLPERTLTEILEARGVGESERTRAVALSGGSAERALAFVGDGAESLAEIARRVHAAIDSGRPGRTLSAAEEIAKHPSPRLVLEALGLVYRDVAWTNLVGSPPPVSLLSGAELRDIASAVSAENAARRVDALLGAAEKLERAINAELYLSALLPALARSA